MKVLFEYLHVSIKDLKNSKLFCEGIKSSHTKAGLD